MSPVQKPIQAQLSRHAELQIHTLVVAVACSLCCTPARAQQPVAPQIETLPPVVIVAPRERRSTRAARRAPTLPASNVRPASAPSPARQPTEVVVSPTAIPTPIEQIASSVTVITAQEIQRDQRRTVPDALSTVPGLNVVQSGGPGAFTSVFLRGTNPNHVKVFIDGIDVSDPSNTARTFDFGQLLTDDIERIEVLRGPQSGLYGADALGGVISIITKSGKGPPRATGTLEGGSFGTFNQNANLRGSTERFNYAFNASHFRATDTPVTPLELLPPGRQRINDYYDNWTYSTKLGADVSENVTLNAVARHTDATLRFTADDFSVFPAVPSAAQSIQHQRQSFARGEAVWSLFEGVFINRFSSAYTDHWSWNKSPEFAPSLNEGDRIKNEWRGDVNLAPGNVLVFGLQQEKETLHTAQTSAQNGNKAGYAELQSSFAERLFVVANIRHDNNESFGARETWRVAPAVILPVTETKLKASYGTGFKAPTLSQLYVNFPEFNFFGNPNLKPEESTGYDYGFEQPVFNDRLRFGATWFRNDITNLIAGNVTFTSYTNIGQAFTYGTEVFGSATITERLKLRADYTYTVAKDAITGLDLLRRPMHKGSLTAAWNPIDALSLSSTILHVGSWIDGNRNFSIPRLTAPGYTIVNLAANYKLTRQTELFGRIDNLFNKHYQNPTGFERPGFGIFGGMRFTYDGGVSGGRI